jgi:hypothetical protein
LQPPKKRGFTPPLTPLEILANLAKLKEAIRAELKTLDAMLR